MKDRLFLGIDVGTSRIKAVLVDVSSRVIARAAIATRMHHPAPLAAEADPEDWWQAVRTVIRQVILQAGDPSAIAAVATTGLMQTPVFLAEDGKPLCPSPLWLDLRALAEREIPKRPSGPMLPLFGPKVAWALRQYPALIGRLASIVLPKDYIRLRLTGSYGTDEQDARATGLWHAKYGWRSAELAVLPEHVLPPVQPADALAGGVTEEASAETGIPAGTPVAVGTSDAAAARIGTGPLPEGAILLYLGTSAWLARRRRARYVDLGATIATAAALNWLRHITGLKDDLHYQAAEQRAAELPAGAAGLFFLPHLMGERGPVFDPRQRGAFLGLTLYHGPEHLLRAVWEGTAYQIRQVLESAAGAAEDCLYCIGGLAGDASYTAILAMVLGRPLEVCEEPEVTALGAALVSRKMLDGVAPRPRHGWRTVLPRPGSDAYEALFARYRQIDQLFGEAGHPLR